MQVTTQKEIPNRQHDKKQEKPKFLNDREKLQIVRQEFKTKISPYLAKLTKKSEAISKQFVPDPREADDFVGSTRAPFEEGKLNQGIYGMERIYEDRVLLTPYFECSAYCRYCFKKTRTLGGEAKAMNRAQLDQAFEYIAKEKGIKTLLITGGDPFLAVDSIEYILQRVQDIDHINHIRIGTRNILFEPQRITPEVAEMISRYQKIDPKDPKKSKVIGIGLSINHKDELTPEIIEAVNLFTSKGIAIYGQSVLMKGINDTEKDLYELIEYLMLAGINPYYLLHCMPVVGSQHLRTSVSKGQELLRSIEALSGTYAFKHYIYVSPIGKHRVSPHETLKYINIGSQRYIERTSAYKANDFLKYSGKSKLPEHHYEDERGFIVSRYLDAHDEA
ncbi:MAG: radical SAM protein [Bdellovibrionales bacterium]|nr:radical SAM protein [Bdellovibrionales bacterium]